MSIEAGDIREERSGERGRYVFDHGEAGESELTYLLRGSEMVVDHTFTPPAMRGHGIAGALVARAVDDALERGWHINPVCPYVRIKIERTPAFRPVLKPSREAGDER